jgi:hypothetical protein
MNKKKKKKRKKGIIIQRCPHFLMSSIMQWHNPLPTSPPQKKYGALIDVYAASHYRLQAHATRKGNIFWPLLLTLFFLF